MRLCNDAHMEAHHYRALLSDVGIGHLQDGRLDHACCGDRPMVEPFTRLGQGAVSIDGMTGLERGGHGLGKSRAYL